MLSELVYMKYERTLRAYKMNAYFRFAIQSNGAEKVVLSPQIQLSCNKEQRGCNGGHIDKAWNFARLYG